MITEPITIKGRLAVPDLLHLNWYAYRYYRGNRVLQAVMMSMALGGIVFVAGKTTPYGWLYDGIFAAFVLYHGGWFIYWHRRITQAYRQQEEEFVEHTVIFDSDGITLSSADSFAQHHWEHLSDIVVTRHGLLFIRRTGGVWFWLPRRVLGKDTSRAMVLQEAGEKKVRLTKMGWMLDSRWNLEQAVSTSPTD